MNWPELIIILNISNFMEMQYLNHKTMNLVMSYTNLNGSTQFNLIKGLKIYAKHSAIPFLDNIIEKIHIKLNARINFSII